MNNRLFVLNLLLVLAACSESGHEADKANSAAQPEHVWKEQVQTLDKAQQVEQTLMDAQQRRDQQQIP